jgi:hypothetical protein
MPALSARLSEVRKQGPREVTSFGIGTLAAASPAAVWSGMAACFLAPLAFFSSLANNPRVRKRRRLRL